MLSNGSVMQSLGETNCGSIGPPAPRESTKPHCPEPFACVTNALKVQMCEGLGLSGPGETKIPHAARGSKTQYPFR